MKEDKNTQFNIMTLEIKPQIAHGKPLEEIKDNLNDSKPEEEISIRETNQYLDNKKPDGENLSDTDIKPDKEAMPQPQNPQKSHKWLILGGMAAVIIILILIFK